MVITMRFMFRLTAMVFCVSITFVTGQGFQLHKILTLQDEYLNADWGQMSAPTPEIEYLEEWTLARYYVNKNAQENGDHEVQLSP